MLLYFKVRNYRSIVETAINLMQDEGGGLCDNDENGVRLYSLEACNNLGEKVRTSPLMAIYGRNASGKSNIIMALCQLQRIVTSGEIEDLYEPNKIQLAANQRTEFSIVYTCPQKEQRTDYWYTYTLEYNAKGIYKEALYSNKDIVFYIDNDSGEHNFSAISNADYDADRIERLRLTECTDEFHNQKTPVLSWLAKKYTNLSRDVIEAYSFFTAHLYTRSSQNVNVQNAFSTLLQTWPDEEEQSRVISEVSDYLSQLDTGILGVETKTMEKVLEPDNELLSIAPTFWFRSGGIHRRGNTMIKKIFYAKDNDSDNHEVYFPFEEESDGTLRLFALLVLIHKTTKSESNVLVIDEMDSSLHPLILRQLMNFFIKTHHNENRSQIIFTAHDTELLEGGLLMPGEVAVVEKSFQTGSRLRKLSNYDAVEPDMIRREYLDGQYAGIPHAHI